MGTLEWTPAKAQDLIQAPERLLSDPPWRDWIVARGGIHAVYDLVRGLPLKDKQRSVLEALLDHPGKAVDFYADLLAIHFTTFHGYRKDLVRSLAHFLNSLNAAPAGPAAPPGAAETPPAAAAPAPPPSNLARPLSSFVGREDLAAALSSGLAATRLLSLVGVGGVGKTRLATEVGWRVLPAFPGGVWAIDLSVLSGPGLVAGTIAVTLGIAEDSREPPLATLVKGIADRRLLLIADNCDHVLEDCAHVLIELLSRCPNLAIIATSREPLGVIGEQLCQVDPLPTPPPGGSPGAALSIEGLSVYPAAQLFLERVGASQPTLHPAQIDPALVATLCVHLDGLPLALELAAVQLRYLSLRELVDRLDQRFQLLVKGNRPALPRHQTLQALVDWSYDRLSAAEQRTFAALAVFAGGWSLEAAEVVGGAALGGGPGLVATLGALVDKSLVLYARPDGGRYRMLETIRQYAAQKFAESADQPRACEAHLGYFLRLAEQGGSAGSDAEKSTWQARIEADYHNVRAALRWALDHGRHSEAVRLAANMGSFWYRRGHYNEGVAWLEQIAALEVPAEALLQTGALRWLGVLYSRQSDYLRATAVLERCLRRYEELEPGEGLGHVYNDLGVIALNQTEYGLAQQRFEASLAIWRRIGDARRTATVLSNLGLILHNQRRYAEALPLYAESLALSRQERSTYGIILALLNSGSLLCEQGDLAAGEPLLAEALELARSVGDTYAVAAALHELSFAALQQRSLARARDYARESLALQREIRDQRGVIRSVERWAALRLAEGRCGEAAYLLGAAEAARESLAVPCDPADQAHVDAIADRLVAFGDQAAIAAHSAAGRAIALDEAVQALLAAG